MKKRFVLALVAVFTLGVGTTAWANYNELTFQKEFMTQSGKVTIMGRGDMHSFSCRCLPSGELQLQIPKGMQGKKLYFQMTQWGAEGIRTITPPNSLEIREDQEQIFLSETGVFSVNCDATEKIIGFAPWGVNIGKEGTHYAIRLLGGTEYADNAFYGQADKVLTESMFYFYPPAPDYKKDCETVNYTMEVTAGSYIISINGEERAWKQTAYQNEDGVLMVPLRDALKSLPERFFQGMFWEENADEMIVIHMFDIYRFTEGKAVYTKNDREFAGAAKMERRDGVSYVSFDFLKDFFGDGTLQDDGNGHGKMAGTLFMPKEEWYNKG